MPADVDFILQDGSEVTVAYTIQGAEPDVGVMRDYAEEWWTTHLHGKRVAVGNTCYRREIDALMMELEIEPNDPSDDYF